MLKISFELDENTKEIFNLTVETESSIISKSVEVAKRKKTQKVQKEESDKILLLDNKIQLSKTITDLIFAKEGDRIVIGYKNVGEKLFPFIGKADCFSGQEGNKLTKTYSVSYRGDQNKTLLEHGTDFDFENQNDGTLKLIGQKEVIKKAVVTELPDEIKTLVSEIDKNFDLSGNSFNL